MVNVFVKKVLISNIIVAAGFFSCFLKTSAMDDNRRIIAYEGTYLGGYGDIPRDEKNFLEDEEDFFENCEDHVASRGEYREKEINCKETKKNENEIYKSNSGDYLSEEDFNEEEFNEEDCILGTGFLKSAVGDKNGSIVKLDEKLMQDFCLLIELEGKTKLDKFRNIGKLFSTLVEKFKECGCYKELSKDVYIKCVPLKEENNLAYYAVYIYPKLSILNDCLFDDRYIKDEIDEIKKVGEKIKEKKKLFYNIAKNFKLVMGGLLEAIKREREALLDLNIRNDRSINLDNCEVHKESNQGLKYESLRDIDGCIDAIFGEKEDGVEVNSYNIFKKCFTTLLQAIDINCLNCKIYTPKNLKKCVNKKESIGIFGFSKCYKNESNIFGSEDKEEKAKRDLYIAISNHMNEEKKKSDKIKGFLNGIKVYV